MYLNPLKEIFVGRLHNGVFLFFPQEFVDVAPKFCPDTYLTTKPIFSCVYCFDMSDKISSRFESFGAECAQIFFIGCTLSNSFSLERIMLFQHVSMKVEVGWTFFTAYLAFGNCNFMSFLMLYCLSFIVKCFPTNISNPTSKRQVFHGFYLIKAMFAQHVRVEIIGTEHSN